MVTQSAGVFPGERNVIDRPTIADNMEAISVPKVELSRESLGVPVTEQEWNLISTSAYSADDPQAELYRYASAITFAREYNMPISSAMQNLDSLTEHQTGKKFTPDKSALQSIRDSLNVGKLAVERNEAAAEFMSLHQSGSDTSEVEARIAEIDAQIEAKQDNIPRSLATRIAKFGAELIPYTMEVFNSGGKGGLATAAAVAAVGVAAGVPVIGVPLGAAIAGGSLLGASYAVGQTAFSINKTRELQRGTAYYDMVKQGVDSDIASKLAEVEGTLYGIIESLLNQFGGAALNAVGIDTVASKIASKAMGKMAARGTLGATGQALSRYLISGAGEGVEETVQSFTTSARESIVEDLTGIATEDSRSAIEKAVENGVQGFFGGLLLGLPVAGVNARIDMANAQNVEKIAETIPSRKAF
ncbi:MAG: hypothetical protein JXK93_14040, partial [Sphaerochaetaceae bacterium]|nr:hypothetical protein [Sphaerochaetaceae bacterium]